MPPKGAVKKPTAPKTKKPKAKKDPNQPKKPSGAYIWFCNDTRAKLKGDHAEWGVAEIGKELGKLWGELEEGDKKKYIAQAEKDKVRYQKDMEKYNATKKEEPAEDEEKDEDDDEEEEEKKPAPKKAAPKKKPAPKKKKEPEPEEEDDDDDDDDEDEELDEEDDE